MREKLNFLSKAISHFFVFTLFYHQLGCAPMADSDNPLHSSQNNSGGESFLSGERRYRPVEILAPPQVGGGGSLSPKHSLSPKRSFRVLEKDFRISRDKEEMSLEVLVEVGGKKEKIRLSGHFNSQSDLWRADLFPVDHEIRAQRRVEATAWCLDAAICQSVAIDLSYLISGQIERVQLQTNVPPPRPLQSGDGPADFQPNGRTEPSPQLRLSPEQAAQSLIRETPKEISLSLSGEFDRGAADQIVLEYQGEVQLPQVRPGPFSIPRPTPTLEPASAPIPSLSLIQALNWHDRGYLQNANYVPEERAGCQRRKASIRSSQGVGYFGYATKAMDDFIAEVCNKFVSRFPGSKLTIGAIAKQGGGRLPGQRSHQTGLDVDIDYVTKKADGLNVIPLIRGRVNPDWDIEKTWELFKIINSVANEQVMVVFTTRQIKANICEVAKRIESPAELSRSNSLAFKTLQGLVHDPAHGDHFHVRLKCPGTPGCGNRIVDLPARSTGC